MWLRTSLAVSAQQLRSAGVIDMLKVKAKGFEEGRDLFGRAADNYETTVGLSLLEFGEHAVDQMKQRIESNSVKPQKLVPDGKPTLVDDGTYKNSYKVEIIGNTEIGIGPTGQNSEMSNAELGERIEFGDENMVARPHQRPWREQMRQKAGRKIGDSIVSGIFKGKK